MQTAVEESFGRTADLSEHSPPSHVPESAETHVVAPRQSTPQEVMEVFLK